jgi:hypothetical protein
MIQTMMTECKVITNVHTGLWTRGDKLEAPRSLYSSPGYNNNISQ